MATPVGSRPRAITLDVEYLVQLTWTGKIRMPHFQRDFRWGWEDVRRLFDSIVNGYPVGSLLFWQRRADAERIRLGALEIDAPKLDDAYWVVDGQQRVTSLANALSPTGAAEPRFALSYDLEAKEFVHTPAVENPLIVPLPTLFDLQRILRWFSRFPHIGEYLDYATGITRLLRQFEVPAYLVAHDDPRVLRDIFDRMNNYGKRLSRAEVFSALNAGDEAEQDDALTFEKIAEHIDIDRQFGKLDAETVLAAVLARRGPEVRRDIRTEFSGQGDEGRTAAYEAGEIALDRAIRFLQNEVGVPHVAMLAYRYLLVALSRFFAFHPDPLPRNRRLLTRWYWRAAVASPEHFRGGTPNAARVLCAQITAGDESGSVQRLLSAVEVDRPTSLDLTRFATNEAATKMLLCVWWANEPRNPMDGEPYALADLNEALAERNTARDAVRYVVGRNAVPGPLKQWAANRVLMPTVGLTTSEISAVAAQQPLLWDDSTWTAFLSSHAINADMVAALRENDIERFLSVRQVALTQQANDYISLRCEWNFEDTPPLSEFVVDDELDDNGNG